MMPRVIAAIFSRLSNLDTWRKCYVPLQDQRSPPEKMAPAIGKRAVARVMRTPPALTTELKKASWIQRDNQIGLPGETEISKPQKENRNVYKYWLEEKSIVLVFRKRNRAIVEFEIVQKLRSMNNIHEKIIENGSKYLDEDAEFMFAFFTEEADRIITDGNKFNEWRLLQKAKSTRLDKKLDEYISKSMSTKEIVSEIF